MLRPIQIAAAVLAIAGNAGNAGAQSAGLPRGAPNSPIERSVAAPAQAAATTHGSWTRGPGTYSFTICAGGARIGSPVGAISPLFQRVALTASVCDIAPPSGTTVSIAIQAWGAGGGGGGGRPGDSGKGGPSGGGGGGGGYATLTQTVAAPITGSIVWTVTVGAGGTAGPIITPQTQAPYIAGSGGASQVQAGGANGPVLVSATGGVGGQPSSFGPPTAGQGGAPGHGSVNSWTGTAGYAGSLTGGCSGAAGGLGGAGGGPGRINDGGAGGHGGYFHAFPTCTAAGQNYQLAAGARGGDGKVVLSW